MRSLRSVPGMKLLVIDDEPMVCRAVRRALRSRDVNVVDCTEAARALEIFRLEEPDVVLCDLAMPRISGIDVLRAIRRESATTRVILMTGSVESFAREDLHAHADAVIAKPWGDDFLEKLGLSRAA